MTGAATPTPTPTPASPSSATPADHLGDPAEQTAGLWNVANMLTMIRLVLVPGFVLLLVHGDGHDPAWRSVAWAAFAVAMITDLFDGELARRYGLVTDFGKIADPIADKAIMGAALIGLSGLGDLPWWVTIVVLVRELGITVLRFWVIRHGVIPASRGGKLKTLTQGVAVGMYILILTGPLASIRAWIMAAAVILTVATGVDYIRQAIVLRRAGLAAEAEARAAAAAEVAAVSAPVREAAGATRASAAGAERATGSAAAASGAPAASADGGSAVTGPAPTEQVPAESVSAESAPGEPVAAPSGERERRQGV
jgi:CDP-diacylglycerol--glycerol-3-phosphate 3-phosphatidyltransferase